VTFGLLNFGTLSSHGVLNVVATLSGPKLAPAEGRKSRNYRLRGAFARCSTLISEDFVVVLVA
jgi:hypothetical protein